MVTNKEKNFISAVLYVHNNEIQIVDTLRKVNEVLNDNFEHWSALTKIDTQ